MFSHPASQRRHLSVDVNQTPSYKHTRVPSRTDSVSSEGSSSSTLVEDMDAFPAYLDSDHVMMHLEYMRPIPEGPERTIPPSPSSSLSPDDHTDVTPMASTRNLLSSSPTSLKPRLWLHRRKCPPPPTHQEPAPPSPPSPTDTRASFLSSLLNARWPKSEPESPIFGQTTPRALSPFRTHPTARPPSQASVPRSILRADSRAGRSARSLASVKFAERPGVWEYSDEDDEDDGLPPCSPGYTARRSVVAGRPGWYGSREALARELKERVKEREHDSDADSVDTYPPPRERERVHSNESFLKRIIGGSGKAQGRPHPPAKGHGAGEKPTISGPMPLQRAASIRGLQQVHKSHAETIIVKPAILAVPPAQAQKKSGKLRNFWGRYVKVS